MERMIFLSSIFRTKKNLPMEEEQTEKEGPCTSYSHQEGDKEMSRKKTPSFGGKKEERISKLLPKSVQNIHEYIKEIIREMYRESQREFDSETNSRFPHSECEHAATHYDAHRIHMPRFSMREMEEGEGMPKRELLVVSSMSMNLKLKSLEIMSLSHIFARSR